MINVNLDVKISSPIGQVFNFVSAPENDFQWQYGTLASTRLPGSITGPGACFQSVGNFMGQRIQSTFEVIEYEPTSRYGFRSISGPLQSFTSFTFEIAKGYTQVKMTMQANVINMMDFSENVLEKKMKRQIKENLSMLKNILEVG